MRVGDRGSDGLRSGIWGGDDGNFFLVFINIGIFNQSGGRGKKGIVAAHAHIASGFNHRAQLANQNHARLNFLPAVNFNAPGFAFNVDALTSFTTSSFFVSHTLRNNK